MKMEIDFVMVNNLWLMKKDLTLIEKTLEKTNFPPNLIVKPSLERKSLYLPTTLEAREHCEPFQKFDAYMREKLGEDYDYFKALSLLHEFGKENKSLYKEIVFCLFSNYCINPLGPLLKSLKKPYIFLLLPQPPSFNTYGYAFQIDFEGKETSISLIYFKGTDNFKSAILLHEIGHHLQLSHCSNKNCVMGLNLTPIDPENSTSLPTQFCEECKRKIEKYVKKKENLKNKIKET